MVAMRTLLAMAAVAAASPAAAQGLGDQILLDDLRMRQQAAERRAIEQANQLMALEARLQADRSIEDLRTQAVPPRLPQLSSRRPDGVSPSAATTQFPAIPDDVLAESNRRVREAAGPR